MDSVFALAESVGIDKAIIICPNGWTQPAKVKASFLRMDLRLWTAEDAARFMDPNFWMFCPICNDGLMIMDHVGSVDINEMILWWIAGRCLECNGAMVWCQDCGEEMIISNRKSSTCHCGHKWKATNKGLFLHPSSSTEHIQI